VNAMFSELVQYAEQLDRVPPYHQETQFQWTLEIGANGDAVAPALVPLTNTCGDKRGKAKTHDGATHLTPWVVRTRGVAAFVPHDWLRYVLGWCEDDLTPESSGQEEASFRDLTEEEQVKAAEKRARADENRKRASQQHAVYVDLIEAWANTHGKDDPVAQALWQFVIGDAIGSIPRPEKWKDRDYVLITVGGLPAHLATSLRPFWTRHVESWKGKGTTGECLICGHVGLLVDTIPQTVKGTLFPGKDSTGVAPISVNEEAFGFNLMKGLTHVPVCVSCAGAIPSALNELLADEGRSRRTVSTVTTWWIKGDSVFDPPALLNSSEEQDIVALIEMVESAEQVVGPVDTSVFNALVVSANKGRMVVHDWTSVPLAELQRNIARWFADTEMEPAWTSESRYVPLWRLATATGRFEKETSRYRPLKDPTGHHPNRIEEELRRTALSGSAPPHHLATWVIARVAADHHVDQPRAALLRLALHRTYQKGNLMPGLDPQCTDQCYVAGRLFAQYEQIQYSAATMDGGESPNTTFTDRNFPGAITNPAMAMATGDKHAAAWLSKLRRERRDAPHVRALEEMMALLDPATPLPTRATIEQQAMFILGFHHQRSANRQAREEVLRLRRTPETSTIDNES